jgi:predicted RNase H-like HicB family nuclease
MAREFSVIIERDAEGYYVASVPALRGCHTQATSLDELMARVREAIELCLEVQGECVEPLTSLVSKDYRRERLPRITGREVVAALRRPALMSPESRAAITSFVTPTA